MILDETYDLIKTRYKNEIDNLQIKDARIGVFLTGVILSDGSCGAASTNVNAHSHCYKKDRDFGEFSPSKIKGRKVTDLFETTSNIKITESLKVAVLNAVSAKIISNSNYNVLYNTDPIDLLDLTPPKTITVVGAFQSYIKKISSTKNTLHVLELDPNALNDDQKKYYKPADEYPKVLPASDIVIITGLTLVNNTLDSLLEYTPPKAEVILTGPSSSIIPDILFGKKVNIIGSTRITNNELLFDIVSEAGTGFHLFKYCAEKFCIINEQ